MTVSSVERRQMAKIKIGQKALRLDDDTYRALLVRVTGVTSCGQMTFLQRQTVLAEMKRLGFKPSADKAHPGRPTNADQVSMLGKVEALLADAGRPWEYARATAERMFGVQRLEWLRPAQLHRLVAALQIDANRRK
ncbi:regulatory protein GemA [Stenotrophomonas sp. B1-1]|uniref:gp16 family protein n=1 Tax=Stenotrophomonas sp. B1-1 TaxID=2710648 RepID=UPI0013D93497|nr:regulatory protein GemA [Stenotrophomonas sp. B1-1]